MVVIQVSGGGGGGGPTGRSPLLVTNMRMGSFPPCESDGTCIVLGCEVPIPSIFFVFLNALPWTIDGGTRSSSTATCARGPEAYPIHSFTLELIMSNSRTHS
jgi:hypothetical protein